MKKCLLSIALIWLFVVGNSQRRMALVVSRPFDSALVEKIRLATFGMYGMIVDSIGAFEPISNDVERTILFVPMVSKYLGTIGLTDRAMFIGVDFFPEPVYGLTIENKCVVSDYLLELPDCEGECIKNYDAYIAHIVLHEVGHILGLPHCPKRYCTMYPYASYRNTHLCCKCKALFLKMKW